MLTLCCRRSSRRRFSFPVRTLVRFTWPTTHERYSRCVPRFRADGIAGALVVRRVRAGAFPAHTVDLLKTFADQSAVAIQNANLFRELEEKSEQLEAARQHKSQF